MPLSIDDLARELGPQKRSVDISNVSVEIRGLSAREIASIIRRFPVFAEVMQTGKAADAENMSPDEILRLMGVIGDAAPSIVAIGLGWVDQEGREPAEERAGSLRMEVVSQLIGPIMVLTMPPGADRESPFVSNGADPEGHLMKAQAIPYS